MTIVVSLLGAIILTPIVTEMIRAEDSNWLVITMFVILFAALLIGGMS